MAEHCGTPAREALAEVALGVADARDRAAVLAHLEVCPSCRRELRAMTEVADGFFELVPPAEPPLGFEQRVLAATRPTEAGAGRRWPRLAIAAAITAALLGGWAAARVLSSSPGPPAVGGVEAAALHAGSRTVGEVVVTERRHPWMSLHLDGGPAGSSVRCQVVGIDGRRVTVGTFWITGGSGYWAAPLPAGLTVSHARLVLPDGKVLAAATLPAR